MGYTHIHISLLILTSRTLALAKARASVENEKSKGTFFPRTFKVEEKKVSLFFWFLVPGLIYGHFLIYNCGLFFIIFDIFGLVFFFTLWVGYYIVWIFHYKNNNGLNYFLQQMLILVSRAIFLSSKKWHSTLWKRS